MIKIPPSFKMVRPVEIFPETVSIRPGKFQMGSLEMTNEGPIREVQILPFRMAIFPVTNGGYRPFLESTGQQIPALVADPSKSEHPVVRVSWYEAISYCQWLNKGTGRKFRLPTEAEWEYAARGPLSLVFPWGKEWDPTRVVFNRSITDATDSVFTHPQGTSVFSSVKQMSGGVWEWVADWYADTYDPEDIRDPKGPKMGTDRVLRGGSWSDDNPDLLRGASRDGGPPEDRYLNVGFRVVED